MTEQTVHLSEEISEKTQTGFILVPDSSLSPFFVDGVLKIGRDNTNDLKLRDICVSSRHCQIEKRPTGFFIKDLRSKNGVLLNGVKIIEGELYPGAEIIVGNTRLVFQSSIKSEVSSSSLFSKNSSWQNTLNQLPSIAQSELPLFLNGESGAGKEMLSLAIHKMSLKKSGPLVCVNCSALTESLVESELFGHIKGAFTGATGDRKGAFEEARGGTLFLDEIGDLPLSLQPKLLRAIENNEIRPVGGDRVIDTNVRIITATHKNLERLVGEEKFRSDLYFRINVVKINIPPLRERMEDFEDLLYLFCREYRVSFSVPSIGYLKSHSWPGNIRELKNTVARAKALFPQTRIEVSHLKDLIASPIELRTTEPQYPMELPLLKDVEKEMIKARLIANGFNQRRTAVELGMPKSTLHDRIKLYNISTSKRPLRMP